MALYIKDKPHGDLYRELLIQYEKNPLIISFEGIDGSGKATQTKKLYNYFSQIFPNKVFLQSFPNYDSETGQLIRKLLDNNLEGSVGYKDVPKENLSSLFALDRFTTFTSLKRKGYEFLVFDRWVESNLAHQGPRVLSVDETNNILKQYLKERNIDKLLKIDEKQLLRDYPLRDFYEWFISNHKQDYNKIINRQRELFKEYLAVSQNGTRLPFPDLIFVLDMHPAISLKILSEKKDKVKSEGDLLYLYFSAFGYYVLKDFYKSIGLGDRLILINQFNENYERKTIDEISKEIIDKVEPIVYARK